MKSTDRSSTEDSGAPVIPEHVIESMARCLLPKLQAFYDSEAGQHAFSEWKAQQRQAKE